PVVVRREERVDRGGPGAHRHARDHREVLDRARDAEERGQGAGLVDGPVAARGDEGGLRGEGLRPREVRRQRGERADRRAGVLGGVERGVEDVGGGRVARAQRARQGRRVEVEELGDAHGRRRYARPPLVSRPPSGWTPGTSTRRSRARIFRSEYSVRADRDPSPRTAMTGPPTRPRRRRAPEPGEEDRARTTTEPRGHPRARRAPRGA